MPLGSFCQELLKDALTYLEEVFLPLWNRRFLYPPHLVPATRIVLCRREPTCWPWKLVKPGRRSWSSHPAKRDLHLSAQTKKKRATNNGCSMPIANGEQAMTSYAIDPSGKL